MLLFNKNNVKYFYHFACCRGRLLNMASNAENKKYKHLTKDERDIIELMLKNTNSLTNIAFTLGRDKTTISKEIKNHRKIKLPDIDYKNLCIHRSKCKRLIAVNK